MLVLIFLENAVNGSHSRKKPALRHFFSSVLWRVLASAIFNFYDKQYFTSASCTPSSLFEAVTALAAALTSTGELSIAMPMPA